MLTVKHIDRLGCERIYSADEVRYVPDVGDAESFGSAGVYLDPEEDPSGRFNGASHVIAASRCGSPDDRAKPTVWVMNRFGATVATYHLKPPRAPVSRWAPTGDTP